MNPAVLVVGAGPVGLMLAGELRLGGVEVVVYDKLPAPSGESRALGFTRRVAELFDQRGLLGRLGDLRRGQQGHFGGIRIDLSMLDEDHHGVLGLPQSRTEEMLEEWLTELGVPVRRGYEAVGLRETPEGVTVDFNGPDGPHMDTARYLVGCDGGQSSIRALADFETTGYAADRGMYMADITGVEPSQRPIGERIPGGNMVLSVSLGDGYYRVLIHDRSLRPPADQSAVRFTDLADTWQRMTGESIHHAQPRWIAAFSNAARLVCEYRRGHVLLAGDAAHDTPPLAGWGMSVGIQDAVNLGWKLAAVINGWAPDELLDTYHAERHPLGRQLLRNVRAASVLYLTGAEMDPLLSVLREVVTYKDAAAHLAGMVSGLSVRYDMGPGEHPQLGTRIPPDSEFKLQNGGRVRLADLLRPARGLLVTTDDVSTPDRMVAGWSGRVDVVTGRWVSSGRDGHPHAQPAAALVRPDGYIAWAAPGGGDLFDALRRWFGPARATSDP